jgi:hypothetical protein
VFIHDDSSTRYTSPYSAINICQFVLLSPTPSFPKVRMAQSRQHSSGLGKSPPPVKEQLYDSLLPEITIQRIASDTPTFLGRLPRTITFTHRVIETLISHNRNIVNENIRDTFNLLSILLTRLTGLQSVLNPGTFNAFLPGMQDKLVQCLDQCQESLETMHSLILNFSRNTWLFSEMGDDFSKAVLMDYGLELDRISQRLFDILNEILMYSIFKDNDNLDLVKYPFPMIQKRLRRRFGQVTRQQLRN